jgi:hypothetical protein
MVDLPGCVLQEERGADITGITVRPKRVDGELVETALTTVLLPATLVIRQSCG